MRMVQLICFLGGYDHPAPFWVNPEFVVSLQPADAGSQGQQCWMHLSDQAESFLISGSIEDVAQTLNGDFF